MATKQKSESRYNEVMKQMIREIEDYCHKNAVDHRFVGGVSYGGLLNERTTYSIDIKNRTIKLRGHNPLVLLRSDGTVRDIDIIFLTQEAEVISKLKKFINKLKWDTRLKISFTPSISFEGPIPFTGATISGQFLQYVTEIGLKNGAYYLIFDQVVQPISYASLEPWTLVLGDGLTYTTRNPIADFLAYQFRSPSGIKPKDVEKLSHLKKLADAVKREGKKYHIDYRSAQYYGPWKSYIKNLTHSTIPSIKSKRIITQWYWKTLGTRFAHGQGLLGKFLLGLYNLAVRLKQP